MWNTHQWKSPSDKVTFQYFGFSLSLPFHTYSFVYHWRHINVAVDNIVKWNTAISLSLSLSLQDGLCSVELDLHTCEKKNMKDVIPSFIYPTECTSRLFWENVKTYIKIYFKLLLHVSV